MLRRGVVSLLRRARGGQQQQQGLSNGSVPLHPPQARELGFCGSPSSSSCSRRNITYMPRPGDGAPRAVTLIPGDGIGPLVTGAVVEVMKALHAPVYFEAYEVTGKMDKVPHELMDSIRKNKVCLKGGLATPVGGGVSSLNVQLRKELDLFASLVHCFNLPGLRTRHDNVNIVVIRENTEGEYAGLEHEVVPGVVESLKVITKFCSERIAKYAFEYAYLNNRKTVTAVHKANIMKLADGLFLESCREVAKKYPGIKYNEIIVDNCCMQLVSRPEQFDVMVTPNLYGNLVANTAAGIAGGTGVMPGGNVGAEHAIFEQGASAGNVGNEKLVQQKTANPTALLLSSAMMLRHLQFPSFADRLEQAVLGVVEDGKHRTKDLGGSSTTQQVVDAVIAKLADNE
ncbi:isocitrate dehydrogenase [NAD] regulatory subunit 1, mitochondrial isoform X1 [Selaginella moellendorffii]|nr:isocitrate dehydrogenase [NAD] regulatory subunit 1, mitochondrial isoform X1 [Selaginella moellendorffii]|eukprot:XP_002985211.2 isocitrate dehydrogenase [NAD] regulatory subunit 1, mitochondrial isoform X1 [Selaginella moellendorffii]